MPTNDREMPCPLKGHFRINENLLSCGTIRIARFDIDTNPSPEFRSELYGWIEQRLNASEAPAAQGDVAELRQMLVDMHEHGYVETLDTLITAAKHHPAPVQSQEALDWASDLAAINKDLAFTMRQNKDTQYSFFIRSY